MKLLDTHTFLWFINEDSQLSEKARALIEDLSDPPVLSVASLWEIAIKVSTGKLNLIQPFEILIPLQMSEYRIGRLDISIFHLAEVARLPFHHRDPFDRLLIAQARVERMPIVSRDTAFDTYDIERLW